METTTEAMMSVLIVVESCFGNTRVVAEAVADGLATALGGVPVTVVAADDAPLDLPAAVDLLLVGAPTHAFSMPSSRSRQDAARQGASPAPAGVGVRDWIARVTPRPDLPVVTFDTSVKLRFTPGTAAKAARKALARRGFARAERGPSFYVTGTPGPLVDGEAQRAKQWAAGLVDVVRA
jgi:hypothetical protein